MVGKTLSHYKILEELGRGGMGIVYKAEDTKLDRTVAIKVLPSVALSSEDDRARFYREAKAAAQLHHPHIASVFEIDEAVPEGSKDDDLRPFISMEYIEGETLSERIKKGPLKLEEAVRIASQIASGLEAAHEKDIVHRDLKSQNVMLTSKSEAKILDFGLAKTTASTKLTQMGSTVGTIGYMSPEQARGEEVDRRTDIWSLGVVLYEMISGRHPFPGEYEQALVYSILNEDPEPLTAVRTGVPMGLEWIVNKMVAKKAAHRYQSAAEAIVDLQTVDLNKAEMPRASATSKTFVGHPSASHTTGVVTLLRQHGLPIVVTAVVVFAAVKIFTGDRSLDAIPIEYSIALPGVVSMEDPEISSDGTRIAFQGRDATGRVGIFEQILMPKGKLHYLYDYGAQPIYSPDSRLLTYLSGGPIRVHSSIGGPSQPIPGTEGYRSYAWLDNSNLLALDPDGNLAQVSLNGAIESIVRFDTMGDLAVARVNDIDESRRFATINIYSKSGQSATQMGIVDVEEKSYWVLRSDGAEFGYFVDDKYLMYIYTGVANPNWPGIPMVQKISRDRRTLEGTAVAVFPDESEEVHGYAFGMGADGSLYFAPNHSNSKYNHLLQYELLQGAKKQNLKLSAAGFGWTPSPEGNLLAQVRDGSFASIHDRQIEVLHMEDGRIESLFRSDSLGENLFWGPDNESIYFTQVVGGTAVIKQLPVDLSTQPVVVLEDAIIQGINQDGNVLAFARPVFGEVGTGYRADGIYLYDRISNSIEMHRDSIEVSNVDFSPDGEYLAYKADLQGQSGVFVDRVFERNPRKVGDGLLPLWDPSGNFLYFTGLPLRSLKRIPITLTPTFRIAGVEETLFDQWYSKAFRIDFDNNLAYTNTRIDVDINKDAYIMRTENFQEYVRQLIEREQ